MQQIGRFQVVERLGRGAMGVVYRALDPRIGRTVAIKSIRLGEISDSSELKRLRDRLEREARSAGALSHRNIVTIYDILEEEKLVHLFMEYVNGPSLEKMLSERKLPEKAALVDFFRQVASGLDYAHRVGIIHRDVKPSNLMLHFEKGTGEQVAKITDFGVAKFVSQQLTQIGSMMGTPNYMAPEQIEGSEISGQTDQFALAAVVYEIMTGEKPFVADYIPTLFFRIVRESPRPAHSVNGSLSPSIDAVLQRALAKTPSDRYENCSEFIAALVESCEAQPDWAPPYPLGTVAIPELEEREPLKMGTRAAPEMVSSTGAGAGAGPAAAVARENPTRENPTVPAAPPPPRDASADKPADTTPPISTPPEPPTLSFPPIPPQPQEEATRIILPYDVPRSRRRDWDEEPEPGLPLWRKIAITALVCAMAGIAFLIYKSYFPANEAGAADSQPSATAKPESGEAPETAGSSRPQTANGAPVRPPISQESSPEEQAGPREQPAANVLPLPRPKVPSSLPGIDRTAPKPQPVGAAQVQFRSEPSQARVVVDRDESKACQTPCSLSLTPGRHTLTMVAANYAIAHRIIQVPDQRVVLVPLSQNVGIVQIDSIPKGSAIYVDGRLLGQTPATLKLASGTHQVRLTNGSRSQQETITVNPDSLQEFTFRWQ